MPAANPTRNVAIEYLLRAAGLTAFDAAAIASGIVGGATFSPAPVAGDARSTTTPAGESELIITGLHGDAITPPVLTADTDDYAPGGAEEALIWRLDLDGFGLTGIAAPAQMGEAHVIVALTAGSLHHEDTASVAENRIAVGGGADLAMVAGDSAWVVYDGIDLRWRVVGLAPSAGAGDALIGARIALGA